ncbi:MAG: N-acetylglucosamine-6-phosphate deacetylase [Thermoprotei archaeon]|nr:MAG: N-acetylglucosamine-6-phosphate deacetylase [Thermoprotei archaeon]
MLTSVLVLENGYIVTPYRVIKNGVIVVEGSKVVDIGVKNEVKIPADSWRIDVKGNIVAPGFIDIHVHGGGGADTMDATYDVINTISKTHARGGTTALVPTTVSAPLEDIIRAINAVKEAMVRGVEGAKVLGIHIEGPYISVEQKGAHDEKFIRSPSREEVERLLEYSDVIKIITAAPEVDGCLELGRVMSSRGVLMSIGHSNATIYEVLKAVEAGYRHVTHIYSGCSMVRRIRAYRYPGVVEAAFLVDDLTVEMIADGKHLPPHLIKLVLKNKPLDKVCVVTDAMRAAGLPPGRYRLRTIEAIVDEGVAWLPDRTAFAGSVAKMNTMIKVLVDDVGLPLQDAIRLASINPAKIIGIDGRKGSLAIGKDADIVVMDSNLDVLMTIVEGKVVYRSEALL